MYVYTREKWKSARSSVARIFAALALLSLSFKASIVASRVSKRFLEEVTTVNAYYFDRFVRGGGEGDLAGYFRV